MKDACRKAGIAVLSFMLALTMMPSAGMAFAAENASGGGSALDTDAAGMLAEAAQGTSQDAVGATADDLQIEADLDGEGEAEGSATVGDDSNVVIPAAAEMINQEVPLTTPVAQKESTRSYFLAQTLENTKTIPVVSASLPLDTSSSVEVVEPVEGEGDFAAVEDEGGEDSDESDLASAPIAAESIVVGSFEHRGITYAVEPGGETVAVVAADPNKLSAETLEAQTIVLPSSVSADGTTAYSVSRIADNAFTGLSSQLVISSDSEKSALLIENREAVTDSTDDAENEKSITNGDIIDITAITIPVSITVIDDDAFTGFDTLEYIIVSADNPNYSMYDGALYDADQTCLLLIPEGRTGAVRISSKTTEAKVETFSHHADLSLLVDADSAAFTSENGFDTADITIVTAEDDAADQRELLAAAYEVDATAEAGDTVDVFALLELDQSEEAAVTVVASQGALTGDNASALFLDQPGTAEVVVVANEAEIPAFYALHLNVEGTEPAAAAAATDVELETVAQYNAGGVEPQADSTFVHNRETCAAGGGDLVPAADGRYYGWTCPHYKDYVAYEYSSTPGTPGYVWVPNGITPSAHISKQAVEDGEYYLIAGGKFANTGAVGSGGLFPISQVHNDYGQTACAWWEITASDKSAERGTLRIHCDYGTKIINTVGEGNIAIPGLNTGQYMRDPGVKTALNAWQNSSDFSKILNVLFDHVDAENCSGWFATAALNYGSYPSYLETVTFVGNTAPPSTKSMESMFAGAINLFEFSENFTMSGLKEISDMRWMFLECGSLASFPLQFSQPDNRVDSWGWAEDAISLGSLPDAYRSTPGLNRTGGTGTGVYTMAYMYGLYDTQIRKMDRTKSPGALLRDSGKLLDGTRVWYYAGPDASTREYLKYGKAQLDNTLIASQHVTWDARGGTFSHSTTSSPTGSTAISSYNCSYIEPIYLVNGSSVTTILRDSVNVPQSPKKGNLHFLGWYEKVPVGITDAQRDLNEKNCVYRWEKVLDGYNDNNHTIANPGETKFYYALYGEDQFIADIKFDINTGQGQVPDTIEDQTANVAMRVQQLDQAKLPSKPGYIFDGFWSDKVGGKQYYDKNGYASDDIRWTEQAEDMQNPVVTLYAHWKYKVYLDLNTYNTDNELVLNGTTSTNTDDVWAQNSGAELELTQYLLDTQTGLVEEPVVQEETVLVEGAENGQLVRTKRYYIEATSGAPLNLPKVKNRTGYSDTFVWGLVRQDNGTASDIVTTQEAEGYLANDEALAKKYADLVAANPNYDPTSDQSITLYADWSGKAKSYWVQLQANYSTSKAPADTFAASANGTQYVQVTYDQPINLAASGLQKPVDGTTRTNSSEPRNLRFTGFRSQQNSVDTNDGKEYLTVSNGSLAVPIANGTQVKFRETNDGKTGATVVTATPNASAGSQQVIVLYAKYLNPEVTATVDLQGGFLDDVNATPSMTVVTNDPVPELASGINDIPTRAGYMFNGYWTTKYTEQPGTYETIDGRKVETKQYYKANSKGTMVPMPDATDSSKAVAWTSYQPNDKLYAHWKYKIYLNTNEWYLGATEAGDEAIIANVSGLETDMDGRKYILATVGEPIQLPEVKGRTGYLDEPTDYAPDVDTRAWGVAAGKYGSATAIIPLESNATFATANTPTFDLGLSAGKSLDLSNDAAKSVWGEDLFSASAKNATFPQPETEQQRRLADGTLVDNPEYQSITLYLDWSKRAKQYTINLKAAYDDDANKITYGAQNGYTERITAQYDAPLLKRKGDAVVTTIGDDPVTAPVYQKVPKNGYTAYDDQVFGGYYDAIIGGTEYIGAQVENDGVTIASQMSPALTGSNGATYAVPFRLNKDMTLYARWSMPVCQVSFDMNDGRITRGDDKLLKVTNAFTIEAGDQLPYFGETNVPAYGNTDTSFLKTQPYYRLDPSATTGSDYTFAGYYDAPAGGTRYYTASLEPVPGITWDKYGNTTLYARWTYKVEMDLNATSPKDGYTDSLQVLGGAPAVTTNAAGRPEMTVVYGAEASIPASTSGVTRLRNANGELAKQPTGYTFAGWYDASAGGNQVCAAGSDLKLNGNNKTLLKPSNGVAQLYADWTQVTYQVTLDHTSGGVFAKTDNFRTNSEGYPIFGRTNALVKFDGTLLSPTDPVAAPQLMGWTFTGYWTKPQAANDVNDTAADKGVQYAKPVAGDATQMVGIDGLLWSETAADGKVTLYAHYKRIRYELQFDKNAGTDRVTFESDGSTVTDLDPINAYFDMELSTASPSSARTLKRTGYKFAGWAACEDYAAYQKLTEAEQAEALCYTADGAAVANKRYRTEGDLTLNALWEPMALTLTWYANYPSDDASVEWATTHPNYGDALAFPKDENGKDPEFIGYKFLGWYNGKGGTAMKLTEGDPYKPSNPSSGPKSYYAQWEIVSYSFTLLPGAHGSYGAAQGDDASIDPSTGWYTQAYTVESDPGDFPKPEGDPGWTFNGWEELSEGYAPTTNHYGATELSKLGALTAERLATQPEVYDGKYFRAKWKTEGYTLTLDANGAELPSEWDAVTDIDVEYEADLPVVSKPGYTFRGWYAKGVNPDDPGATAVTQVSGATENLTYVAQFRVNKYKLRFVQGTTDATKNIEVADSIVATVKSTDVKAPTPTRYDTFATEAAAAGKDACSVFDRFTIKGKNGKEYSYYVGDTISVDALAKLVNSTASSEEGIDGVFTLVANWDSTYNVAVPLKVEIAFDRERLEVPPVVGEHYMEIKRGGKAIEVAQLMVEPVATAGTVLGTEDAFKGDGDAKTDLSDFVTLTLTAGDEASANPTVRLPLSSVKDSMKVSAVSDTASDPAATKSLGDAGFRLGGVDANAVSKLPLRFNLEFANGFNATRLTAFDAIRDQRVTDSTGAAKLVGYPIARIYYVLSLVR